MADLLAELRAALAFQRELGGRFVPRVDVPVEATSPSTAAVETAVETPFMASLHAATLPTRFDPATQAPTPARPSSAPPEPVAHAVDTVWTTAPPAPEPPPASPVDLAPSPSAGAPPDSDDDMAQDLFGNALPDDPAPDTGSPYERIEALIPEDHPVKGATTLAEAEQVARDTVFIPLDENRINPVFGVGSPTADLLIIGEAPGADEDRTGEPFVGRAGQLLTKILAAIGMQRDEVYIGNILKSRPPGNRDPEPEEIAAHLPMLYKQIALIRPKVLLCVGKTAGNALLGRRSALAGLRDKEHDFHGLPLFVTYHPAALLRNEQWKRPTWEDVQLMHAALQRERAKG